MVLLVLLGHAPQASAPSTLGLTLVVVHFLAITLATLLILFTSLGARAWTRLLLFCEAASPFFCERPNASTISQHPRLQTPERIDPLSPHFTQPSKEKPMKWATRKNIKVDRMACAWLIKRFIDEAPEISFVEEHEIQQLTAAGVNTFDAKGAKYQHPDGLDGSKYGDKCSFQTMLDAYNLVTKDPALHRMGEILYVADIGHRVGVLEPREGLGLWAIAQGLALTVPKDNDRRSTSC
jgi:hypothetical protein